MKKTKLPKLSVITPSYNQGQFIGQTIDSVLSQKYPDLEYWVIDGKSTDNTVAVLKSYGRQIKWISEKDRGQAHALNKGLARSTGEILTYLNADDVYLPNTFNTVVEYFAAHRVEWVTGDYFIVDETGKKIQSYVAAYKTFLRNHPSFQTLSIANYIIQPSTFWRKSLTDKIGLFDETLTYCMDYDYWLRAYRESRPAVLENHFSLFRIHNTSKGKRHYKKQFDEEHEVMKRYAKSPLVRALHKLHAGLTVAAYKIIK